MATTEGNRVFVATMLAHDIHTILTHNTDDYARFAGLITVVPLGANKNIRPT